MLTFHGEFYSITFVKTTDFHVHETYSDKDIAFSS